MSYDDNISIIITYIYMYVCMYVKIWRHYIYICIIYSMCNMNMNM